MSNRLALETSPYLLQHKDNPVNWYAWGAEAFEAARRSDRPILLSVGYSACHWCHVMAHESFENPAIAAQMNQGFVNIKVDREERPDVDAIYMSAVQSLTGRGGWPMTVFLTPDGRPFYGGTYYPPEDSRGMPGFPRVLHAVLDAYQNRRADLDRTGAQILEHIETTTRLEASDDPLDDAMLAQAADAILASYDSNDGGFGDAPKFPQPMTLDFLMRFYKRSGRPDVLEAIEHSLRAMASGGMYDQVGGGFHRYSTDAVWLVPHFEKMLYDNALLARTYLDAYKLTRDPFYRRIVQETLDYVLREMTDAAGGFYSTQDADSEGEEGRFFLWTPSQLEEVLSADAGLIGDYFGVTPDGNFEGRNILNLPQPLEAFAQAHGLDVADFETTLAAAKQKLYEAREQRVHPARDEKVLSGWNGLMLRAFADAALAFDSQPYLDAATRNADFLLSQMRPALGAGRGAAEERAPNLQNRRLLRTWKAGEARLNGYLEDYAMLADGLLALYSAGFDSRYLDAASELAGEMIDLFWDDSLGGFFDTGRDHETLITRPRDLFDNATPSGTSVAADVLVRLAVLTDNADFERRGLACLQTVAPFIDRAPLAFGRLLAAIDFYLAPSQELALVWPEDAAQAAPLLDTMRLAYLPNLLLAGGPANADPSTPLLRDRPTLNSLPTAYVCERYVCQSPTTDPAVLKTQLGI